MWVATIFCLARTHIRTLDFWPHAHRTHIARKCAFGQNFNRTRTRTCAFCVCVLSKFAHAPLLYTNPISSIQDLQIWIQYVLILWMFYYSIQNHSESLNLVSAFLIRIPSVIVQEYQQDFDSITTCHKIDYQLDEFIVLAKLRVDFSLLQKFT